MREYRILADERSAEDLSDLFLEKGALAASLEDADADSTDEARLRRTGIGTRNLRLAALHHLGTHRRRLSLQKPA